MGSMQYRDASYGASAHRVTVGRNNANIDTKIIRSKVNYSLLAQSPSQALCRTDLHTHCHYIVTPYSITNYHVARSALKVGVEANLYAFWNQHTRQGTPEFF